MMKMMRLVVIAAVAAMAFASSAFALGGSLYAHIGYTVGAGSVDVTVVSNHSFNGTVTTACGRSVNDAEPLDNWVFDEVAHQNVDGPIHVDTSAAGVGASCTITVTSGKKVLDQKTFVST